MNPDYESRIESNEEEFHKSEFMRDVHNFIVEYRRKAEIF